MTNEKYLQQFLGFQNELKSFLFRLLTNVHDCEDVMQETYIRFSENINTFRGDSSFKTWVFSIAINLAKNLLSTKARWQENFQDLGRDAHEKYPDSPQLVEKLMGVFFSTPDAQLELVEHLDYCFTCMNKTLPLTQQICLLLKDVYGFTQEEIEDITELSEGKVKHGIADARKTMIEIFDNRCALIKKEGRCDQCTALKGRLNPKQDAYIEANKMKMVRERENSNSEKLYALRLELVKSVDPINKPSNGIHIYFLENLEDWANSAKNYSTELEATKNPPSH